MVHCCSVTTCRNWVSRTRNRVNKDLSFFTFPKDPIVRAVWLEKSARKDVFNPDNAGICSEHFLPEDFDPSYLMKKKLMPNCRGAILLKGAVPSQRLPSEVSYKVRLSKAERQKEEERKKAAGGAGSDSDDPEERKQRNKELRRERQEKRERKELVEKLLSEHEKKQQVAQADPGPSVEVIELLHGKHGIRKLGANPGRVQDSMALAVAEAGIVTGPGAQGGTTAAAAAAASAAASASAPAADLSDDDRPSFGDDDGAAPGGDSDEDDVARSPADAIKGNLKSMPMVITSAMLSAALSGRPAKINTIKTFPPVFAVRRRTSKRPDLMVERTKEILRLKLRLRKLEDKCLHVLAVPGAPRTGVSDEPGTEEGKTAEEKAAEEGERHGDGEEGSSPAAPAAALGETPLVILRNDRDSKLPTILKQLRENQLPDSMAMFMPSNLQEAQEVNHRLKVQFLTLQAAMLKWAIKNKKIRNARLKEAEERRLKSTNTVRGARLRELLRIEAAVKAIFTDSQIRRVIRDHGGSSGGGSLDKRKCTLPWGEEDLRRVLELRAISSDKVVEYVREKMKIPLPSVQATKQRCKKSPELNEAFKEMLHKSEENQKLCGMCERQVNTIDEVIEAVGGDPPSDGVGDSPYGRQFVQRVARRSQDTTVARQKKRRRAPAVASSGAKKKRRQAAATAPEWPDMSDSDAELSDPGIWGRIPSTQVSWHPEVIGSSAPPPPRDRPPRPHGSAPDPYRQMQKAWR